MYAIKALTNDLLYVLFVLRHPIIHTAIIYILNIITHMEFYAEDKLYYHCATATPLGVICEVIHLTQPTPLEYFKQFLAILQGVFYYGWCIVLGVFCVFIIIALLTRFCFNKHFHNCNNNPGGAD